ncbi:haloacid dehalogenase [Kosmotoga arenicorallina S304]|uniref:Haloacid dehalogenase n=1 Tax=Kosmotoga arenicorallina S304 TaxID=1453497 RepID=A0A176K0H8_9BACT|nr:YqeG family HAD IIIA-type phosphatase [Kosmotoga arenicorallina]OAA30051.1 haloacid dehalogenase [Kosmotoga arenicorallina S304]
MRIQAILDSLKLPLPRERAKSVRDIDYSRLHDLGYDTILFDYDNTLATWRNQFDTRNRKVIESLLEMGLKVAVVTNAPYDRVKHMKRFFGNRIKLYHSMKKPGTRELLRVLKALESKPESTVIIGDLFLTDVIAGNRMGMYTIMVKPAVSKEAAFYKKLAAFMTIATYTIFFYTIGWFLRITELVNPHLFIDDVSDIDFEQLKEAGYELVILDFDNTLEPWGSDELSKEKELLIRRIQLVGLKIVIISNGRRTRLRNIEAFIPGVEIISEARKPFPHKARKYLHKRGIKPYHSVVIGDQLFTDVLMGNLLGAFTIKVNPISEREFYWTRMMRRIEKLFLKLIKRKTALEEIRR